MRAVRALILCGAILAAGLLLRCNPLIALRVQALIDESRQMAAVFAHDAAIGQIEQALRLRPDRADLYIELGRRIALIYEWDRAIAAFDWAERLDPGYAETYYFRGLLYASAPSAQAREDAIRDLERYLALAPDGMYAADAGRSLEILLAQRGSLSDEF